MAKCDQGYLCVVCGEEVKRIDQSELYLKYVVGWIDGRQLNALPERHLTCNPSLAQFIVDPIFESLEVIPEMSKALLDSAFRSERETLLTAGYQRLKFLQKHRRDTKIDDYPLDKIALQLLSEATPHWKKVSSDENGVPSAD